MPDDTLPWLLPSRPWVTWEVERRQAERLQSEKTYQDLSCKLGLPALPKLPTMPGSARWYESIQVACCLLDMVHDEMQDYIDARSDEWQDGDRGMEFMERHEGVESVLDDVRSLMQDLSTPRTSNGKPGCALPASEPDDPFAN